MVRDQDGTLRAFSNVCRHRAAPVVTEPCGSATRLRCRYHGWTYDLAGRLRGVPEFDGVEDFCREEQGLPPLAVAEWGPYVWVHAGPQPLALADFLSPLPERTLGRLDGLRFVQRREYELACNWKVFVDNYLDGGYHVNTVHPGLAGVIDYTHYHTQVFGQTSVQQSPLKSADGAVGNVRSGGEAMYWWVFPNFMLNLYNGVMDTNLVLPLGPDRCRIVFDFFFAATEETFIRDSIAVAHQVQMEDAGDLRGSAARPRLAATPPAASVCGARRRGITFIRCWGGGCRRDRPASPKRQARTSGTAPGWHALRYSEGRAVFAKTSRPSEYLRACHPSFRCGLTDCNHGFDCSCRSASSFDGNPAAARMRSTSRITSSRTPTLVRTQRISMRNAHQLMRSVAMAVAA